MIPTRMNPLGSPPYLRRLAHLDSTGTQYINTGLKPVVDFTEAEITWSSVLSCGVRAGYMNGEFRISTSNVKFDIAFGSSAETVYDDFSSPVTVKMCTDGKFYRDGTLIYSGTGNPAQLYDFLLFMANSAGTPIGGGNGKIYRATFRNASGTVRDFIPVMDKSGVRCLFDSITETLYYNAGTGSFGGQ